MFFSKKIKALEKRIEELERGQTLLIYRSDVCPRPFEAPVVEVVEELLNHLNLQINYSPAKPITWIVKKSDE